MDARVRDLLTTLRTAESVEPQWSVIDEWVAGRELARLREAAFSLAEPTSPGWAVSSVLDYLIRRLALTPCAEFAGVVRDLARRRDAPYLASLVATGQSPEVMASLVEDGEFGACLTQELALRSGGVEREPFLSLWKRLWRRGHPLAWLPLRLTAIEEGVALPWYSERGSGFAPGPRREC